MVNAHRDTLLKKAIASCSAAASCWSVASILEIYKRIENWRDGIQIANLKHANLA